MRIELKQVLFPQPKSKIKAGDGKAEGKYKFFTSSPIQSKFVDEANYDKPSLIFGTGGNASVHFCDEPFSTSTDCLVMYGRSKTELETIYNYLKSNIGILENGFKGAGLKHISKDYILAIEIDLPSEEIQLEFLQKNRTIDGLIEAKQAQLHLSEDLVKSRFIEMFGDINVNDKEWKAQPLRELCTIVRGGSPRPIEKFLGGDVPWIKIGDATDGENIYLHSTKEHIIQEGVSKSRLVKAGSLIFANCGVSLGFARIITFDGCIHDGWLAMEDIDSRLDKVFLLQALNQMTEHFRKIAPAGTQPNLNTAIMKSYKQIIPPIELQREFITFVEQTDKSKYHGDITYSTEAAA